MVTTASPTCIMGRHRVAERWFAPAGSQFESHNPAKWDEVLGVFPSGTAEDANEAVAAAREAFPGWRRTSPGATTRATSPPIACCCSNGWCSGWCNTKIASRGRPTSSRR